MNMQRNILIAALLVITYLMVLQWNADYGQGDELPPVATESSQSGNDEVPSLPESQNAGETGNSSAATSDVPPAVEPGGDAEVPQTAATPDDTSGNLIRIETDTLRAEIDPRGGDLVTLSLPQYPVRKDRPDLPFPILENSNAMTYVAQSGLTGKNGPDARSAGRPLYSAESQSYSLGDDEQLVVDLRFEENDVSYIKRFTFTRGEYLVDVDYIIDNQSGETWTGNLFGQIKRDDSSDPSSSSATGMATYLGAAYWSADESYTKVSMSDMDKNRLKETVGGGWVAWLQHYFVTAWIPAADQQHVYQTRTDSAGNYIVGFTSPASVIEPGQQASISADFYAGPKIQDSLKEISPGLELTVDYGFLWWIAQPLFWVLSLIHSFVGNWGWSIILLTVLIKLVFFPLSATSYRSMANMRRVAPKLQALREQHGDDRQKMSQGMMELYKKEKINPLGGCLPILVQMPVFIALYWTLMESVEMRQAPWLGWITDLSLKDPYFILPILMGATMFIQQQLNPAPPDPMQAKVMKMLPIVFTFFFLWFPAGLVLYWVVNNMLSIAQQWYITRQIEKGAAAKGE
ncbi:membrane protein insertase YidC [Halopseudomonas laoshanensis]|uniref:Membrane protein insertase YidC n=1 Tax=Halopseudomonas laoshanensis TaxID=2268758 RepID=A0A7V7KVM0_9GAMM|nr:membrane protein insertase YidC [Halopseudomonas laoshanensis]KAA0694049.1 membrane protein insertase YidC [Halopseudomonas laoshanensis]